MLVYRLETLVEMGNGLELCGPFTASCYNEELEAVTWKYKRQLGGPIVEPEEDGIKDFHRGLVCGWINWRGMSIWCRWKEVTESLEAVGFRIAEYEVPDDKVRVGKTQVCWNPDNAQFIRQVAWDYLSELLYEKETVKDYIDDEKQIQATA